MKRLFTVLLSLSSLAFSLSFPCQRKAPTSYVACIGNSITYGYLLKDRERVAYQAVLQTLLEYEVRSCELWEVWSRAPFQRTSPVHPAGGYRQALAYKADIAVIHLGARRYRPS